MIGRPGSGHHDRDCAWAVSRGTEWCSCVTGRGPWMQTYTGRQFFPLDPRPEDIDHRDIAHALSMVCRFGGHSWAFYSVAEHSVLLSRVVAPEHALWALLHDAAEAYVGDMVRPVKHLPQMRPYREVEDMVLDSIAERFGLGTVEDFPAEVKDADARILLDEREWVLAATDHRWEVDDLDPLGVEIHRWEPARAEQEFLRRLGELANLDGCGDYSCSENHS